MANLTTEPGTIERARAALEEAGIDAAELSPAEISTTVNAIMRPLVGLVASFRTALRAAPRDAGATIRALADLADLIEEESGGAPPG